MKAYKILIEQLWLPFSKFHSQNSQISNIHLRPLSCPISCPRECTRPSKWWRTVRGKTRGTGTFMARQRTLESNRTGVRTAGQVTRGVRNFETGSVFRCTG